MKEKLRELQEALRHEGDFIAFLASEAQANQNFREASQRIEAGPHPTDDMLYDYVLGDLDGQKSEIIEKHLTYCSICAEEVLSIRLFEEDVEERLLQGETGQKFYGLQSS